MNNKGYSTGFTWVFGLVSIFGIGLLYITFDQVFLGHLVPVIKNQVNTTVGTVAIDAATKTQIFNNIDKFMTYWEAVPYILFGVIVIYMIVAAIRKEGESEFV